MKWIGLLIIGLHTFCARPPEVDSHVAEIAREAQQLKAEIAETEECKSGCIFLSAWDFDGTILKGDMAEGLKEGERVVYPGLQQLAVDQGWSRTYRPGSFQKFLADRSVIEEKEGHLAALSMGLKIFRGVPVMRLESLASSHFEKVLSRYYFRSSISILENTKKAGIVPCILSASPHVFARSAAATVGVPRENIYAMETEIVRGFMTDKIVEPVPYAKGKAQRLEMIVENLQKTTGRRVFVVAAFGNSFRSDSYFLQWTLDQKLPRGHALAVMINGGPDAGEFRGLFREVSQIATVSGR